MNYSNRVVALAPSSVKLLQDLQCWDQIIRKKSFDSMYIWNSETNDKIEFKQPEIATIVENELIQKSLVDSLENVTIFNGEKVQDIAKNTVKLSSGQDISCDLLIGADGPSSKVRTSSNIESYGWNYNQMGVVATLKLTENENNTAWQRFLPTGSIAMLPLSNNYSSLVWSTTKKMSEKLTRVDPKVLTLLVNAAFRNSAQDVEFLSNNLDEMSLDEMTKEAEWGLEKHGNQVLVPKVEHATNAQAFPLKLQHAAQYDGEGIVLIGDAAHTIHPLGGQGMNLGLADVACLIKNLEACVYHGDPIGPMGYAKERYPINSMILTGCDFIYRLNGRFMSFADNGYIKNTFLKIMSS